MIGLHATSLMVDITCQVARTRQTEMNHLNSHTIMDKAQSDLGDAGSTHFDVIDDLQEGAAAIGTDANEEMSTNEGETYWMMSLITNRNTPVASAIVSEDDEDIPDLVPVTDSEDDDYEVKKASEYQVIRRNMPHRRASTARSSTYGRTFAGLLQHGPIDFTTSEVIMKHIGIELTALTELNYVYYSSHRVSATEGSVVTPASKETPHKEEVDERSNRERRSKPRAGHRAYSIAVSLAPPDSIKSKL